MKKKFFIGALALLTLQENLYALDDIDRSVLDKCANRCNGESTDCWVCYSTSMYEEHNPFDHPNKDSESDDFDDADPYGNVGFRF